MTMPNPDMNEAPLVASVLADDTAVQRTGKEDGPMRLSAKDQARFAEALLAPSEPNAALLRAKEAYARLVRDPFKGPF